MFIRAQDGVAYHAQTIERIAIETGTQSGHVTHEADAPAQCLIFARLSGQQGSVRLAGPATEEECQQILARIVTGLGGIDLTPDIETDALQA